MIGKLIEKFVPLPVRIAAAPVKVALAKVPREVWIGLALALLCLFLWWRFAAHYIAVGKQECEDAHQHAQERANAAQVKRETKRDTKAAAIGAETREAAAAAVAHTKEATDARDHQIQRVPVTGGCTVPVGLPDLAPAVEAANAASR